MKYPQRFTLADRDDGFTVEITYDAAKNIYLADYGDGVPQTYTEDEITGLIKCSYDIQYNWPDQFSFTHDTTSQLYEMTKLPHHALWACTQSGLAQVGSGATYTAEEIAHHFKEGRWKEISKAEPDERPLVFPFTYQGYGGSGDVYKVYEDADGDLWWYQQSTSWHSTIPNLYSRDEVAHNIKEGKWLVKSVGSSATTAPPEPSKEAAKPLDSVTINVRSEGVVEATEQAKKLAQAIEEVNIALESFGAIFEETREVVFGRNDCCDEAARQACSIIYEEMG